MSGFHKRKKEAEDRYKHDQELEFKASARRNKLLGLWAAELMGMSGDAADAYAKEVVAADFEEAGDEDVIRKLLGDMTSAGVEMDDAGIRAALVEKMVEARRQFIEEAT